MAKTIHLTYVIDLRGLVGRVAALNNNINACVAPGGPLQLRYLDAYQQNIADNIALPNGCQHVCINVILQIHDVRRLDHRAILAETIQRQFHDFANALPAGVVRGVNIWEAFGNRYGRRAPSMNQYQNDRRLVVNNPGNCKSPFALYIACTT